MRYRILFSFLFAFLVFLPSQDVFASGSKTVTRGDPMPPINWSVGGAPGCTTSSSYPSLLSDDIYSQWFGFRPGSGSGVFSFTPVATNLGMRIFAPVDSYTFSCTAGGVTDTATLIVQDCGSGTTWNGATNTCDVAPVSVDGSCGAAAETCTSGTYSNVPADTATDYQWTCLGISGGANSGTCTAPIAAPLVPVTTFTGSYGGQNNVTVLNLPAGGGNVTFDWSITNAGVGGSCTGYSNTNLPGWSAAGTGGKPTSGSDTVSVVGDTSLWLDCWNGSGTATVRAFVTVNVAAVPVATAPVFSASAGNCPIATNASTCSVGFTWQIVDATTPNLYNTSTAITYNGVSGNNIPVAVTFGSNPVQARDGNIPIAGASITVTATCADSNDVWIGGKCTPACAESASCASTEASHCSGESYTVPAVCSLTIPCTGTRQCDYNWKEVAP